MNILVIDSCPERRTRVDEALSWVSDQYTLHQSPSLSAAQEQLRTEELRLAIVGPEVPEDTFAALVFLRGWLPHTPLLTYTKISQFDRSLPRRLLDCGANLVLDQRLSPTQLGLMLRPYVNCQSNIQPKATTPKVPYPLGLPSLGRSMVVASFA